MFCLCPILTETQGCTIRLRANDGDRPVRGLLRDQIRNTNTSTAHRDRYGRLVARVFLPDGLEVNRLLIAQGSVREYCKYSKGFYADCTGRLTDGAR